MRISDWSSDVCSSDLLISRCLVVGRVTPVGRDIGVAGSLELAVTEELEVAGRGEVIGRHRRLFAIDRLDQAWCDEEDELAAIGLELQIGRASCRERECQSV